MGCVLALPSYLSAQAPPHMGITPHDPCDLCHQGHRLAPPDNFLAPLFGPQIPPQHPLSPLERGCLGVWEGMEEKNRSAF